MAPKHLLWAWAALVAALYAVLAYGSYVTLPDHAGDMLGFDMRPFGMSDLDAVAYVNAMTDAGRAYYVEWLKPLDTVFIATLTGLLLALCWVFRGLFGILGAIAALSYAGHDVVENKLVGDVIEFGLMETRAEVGYIANVTMTKFLSLGGAAVALFFAWRRAGLNPKELS